MFEDKTCLILGAGASHPYGFPTSGELRELLLNGPAAPSILSNDLGFHNQDAYLEINDLVKECAFKDKTWLDAFEKLLATPIV